MNSYLGAVGPLVKYCTLLYTRVVRESKAKFLNRAPYLDSLSQENQSGRGSLIKGDAMNQKELIAFEYHAKEDAAAKAPNGMRLWDIFPTKKYAERIAKQYGFVGPTTITPMHDGFVLYITK